MCGVGPQPDHTGSLSEAQGRDIPPRDREGELSRWQVAFVFFFVILHSCSFYAMSMYDFVIRF